SQASGAIRMISSNAFLRRGYSNHTNVEAEVADSIALSLPEGSEVAHKEVVEEDAGTNTETSSIDTDEMAELSTLPSEISGFSDPDTLSYVVAACIHRLDCAECKTELTDEDGISRPTTSSFTNEMTFERAQMLYPKQFVLDEFSHRMKPIMKYYESNFHKSHIVKLVTMKFRLKTEFPSCCLRHKELLLSYFTRMLIRVFCKEKNNKLKKPDTRSKSKLRKLNV
ncbi:MAG: hypothetical protein AAGK05_17475, partial [Pseudomonadota bacterium]